MNCQGWKKEALGVFCFMDLNKQTQNSVCCHIQSCCGEYLRGKLSQTFWSFLFLSWNISFLVFFFFFLVARDTLSRNLNRYLDSMVLNRFPVYLLILIEKGLTVTSQARLAPWGFSYQQKHHASLKWQEFKRTKL